MRLNRKTIIIITIILTVLIVGIMILLSMNTSVNKEKIEDSPTTKVSTEDQKEIDNSGDDSEVHSLSKEEVKNYRVSLDLQQNRHIGQSPSREFEDDSYKTIPEDEDWYKNSIEEFYGQKVDSKELEKVSKVEVFNYPKTKTNFIILFFTEYDECIVEMYEEEGTHELIYHCFYSQNDFKSLYSSISEDGKKIFEKNNPHSFDIGTW